MTEFGGAFPGDSLGLGVLGCPGDLLVGGSRNCALYFGVHVSADGFSLWEVWGHGDICMNFRGSLILVA